MTSVPPAFGDLLEALIAGRCTAQAWDEGVVQHYDSEIEVHRVALVRAALHCGDWNWPDVPPSLASAAGSIHQAIAKLSSWRGKG